MYSVKLVGVDNIPGKGSSLESNQRPKYPVAKQPRDIMSFKAAFQLVYCRYTTPSLPLPSGQLFLPIALKFIRRRIRSKRSFQWECEELSPPVVPSFLLIELSVCHVVAVIMQFPPKWDKYRHSNQFYGS